jgi:hypothetical protein
MREVIDGCKICGRRMLTDGSPLVHRTCDACKAQQRRETSRKVTARRKAERRAARAALPPPRCEQCGKVIEGAVRLASASGWARRFCNNTCRQAAFRDRHG